MAIDVRCSTCGSAYRVADSWAGKRAKCAKCSGQILIPPATAATSENIAPTGRQVGAAPRQASGAPAQSTAAAPGATVATSSSPQLSAEMILAAIDLGVPRPRMPVAYRLAAAVVALLMVVLPLVYVSLIIGIGYAMYLHATKDVAVVGATGPGRAMIIGLLLYAGPLVAGAIAVFFMCKPLIARPRAVGRTRSLTYDSDPLLYAFAERLSRAVGSPVPKRIDVDCQVNASASLGQGLLGLLGLRGMVLTIGLPLAAGLDLRQFTAVLAHELGHFSQGAGVRLFWIIAHVNNWFARAVYERDEWDQRLEQASENTDIRLAVILLLARLAVWLTRRILWCLMMVAHVASAHLSRHMEYDADRKSAMLVGSDAAESTLRQTHVLGFAEAKAGADLNRFYADGRLVDNLPRLVALNARDLKEEDREKIEQIRRETKAGLFDTHPSPEARASRLQSVGAPCRLNVDQPATVLFGNFDQLARAVTLDVYFANFGPKFDRSTIRPLDELVARRDRESKAGEVFERFMLGRTSRFRPIRLPSSTVAEPASPRRAVDELKAARDEVVQLVATYTEDHKQFEKAYRQMLDAEMGRTVFEFGYDAQLAAQFETPMASRQAARELGEKARLQTEMLGDRMAPFEQAAGRRLMASMALLHVDQVAARIPNGKRWRAECDRMATILHAVEEECDNLTAIYPLFGRLHILLTIAAKAQGDDRWVRRVLEASQLLHEQLGHCRQLLFQVDYGMDHEDKTMTVGRYLLGEMPLANDPMAVHAAAESLMESYEVVRGRLRGRLAAVAERVEAVLGLGPLAGVGDRGSVVRGQ